MPHVPCPRGNRELSRYQQQLSVVDRRVVALQIVQAKLKNSRILLRRLQVRRPSESIAAVLESLNYLAEQAAEADCLQPLMGFEGAGAAKYFCALGVRVRADRAQV